LFVLGRAEKGPGKGGRLLDRRRLWHCSVEEVQQGREEVACLESLACRRNRPALVSLLYLVMDWEPWEAAFVPKEINIRR
jgi:hypothetical protein